MTSAYRIAAASIAAAVIALASTGCKSKSKSAPTSNRPAAITAPERKRGADACTAYVARLCKCAETRPELAEDCHMKHAKPEALALALGVDDDPDADRDTILRAQKEARIIIKLCIEEDAALRGCEP